MPPRYPAFQYSAGQWPQQLYYGQQYPHWGYPPPYVTWPGATSGGTSYQQLPHPSLDGHRREHRSPSPVVEVLAHELLGGKYKPMMFWDISQHPSTARKMTSRGTLVPIVAEASDSPATEPGAHFMKIICDLFPWEIRIKVPRNEEITVDSVLSAIFGELQLPITEAEWEEDTNNNRKKMHKSMCTRLARDQPGLKLTGRVRRIDMLGDKTFFQGLKGVGPVDAPEEWLLKLGSPPKKESRH